jgi:hypothetical protein
LFFKSNHGRITLYMEFALHIDSSDGRSWYRCKRARIVDGMIVWEVSPSGRYDLLDAYRKEAHRQFIGADDDGKLLAFLRAWGPFAIELKAPSGRSSVEAVGRYRQELEAWTRLFAALDQPANPKDSSPRQCLIELFRLIPDVFAIHTRELLRMHPNATFGEIEARLVNASREEFKRVRRFFVGSFPGAALANSLVIEESHTSTELRAGPEFVGLLHALNWMVYQDIYLRKPFSFCLECRRLIHSTTEHERRFCDISVRPCARRWTDRKWKADKRETERQEREQEAARARKGKLIGPVNRISRTPKKGKS